MNKEWDHNQGKVVELHLGCGGVKWKDSTNADLYPDTPEIPDSSREGCVAGPGRDIKTIRIK